MTWFRNIGDIIAVTIISFLMFHYYELQFAFYVLFELGFLICTANCGENVCLVGLRPNQ